MPFLFQRKIGTNQEVISPATVVNMLRRRCEELAELHPGFRTACFTTHDFRRLFATELVNNGLPIHDRPGDEYRDVTEQEWREFEENFDKRKVAFVFALPDARHKPEDAATP